MPGEAKIGFIVPRDLCSNNMDGIIKELREIRSFYRAISEVTTGSPSEMKLNTIASSDPSFYFYGVPYVLVRIGRIITWALDTWESVEKIRKLRQDIQNEQPPSYTKIAETLKNDIEEHIDNSIKEQVSKLIETSNNLKKDRKKEIEQIVERVLRSFLARTERGLRIEIDYKPLTIEEDSSDPTQPKEEMTEEQKKSFQHYNEIKSINNSINYRLPSMEPIMQLSYEEKEEETNKKKNAK